MTNKSITTIITIILITVMFSCVTVQEGNDNVNVLSLFPSNATKIIYMSRDSDPMISVTESLDSSGLYHQFLLELYKNTDGTLTEYMTSSKSELYIYLGNYGSDFFNNDLISPENYWEAKQIYVDSIPYSWIESYGYSKYFLASDNMILFTQGDMEPVIETYHSITTMNEPLDPIKKNEHEIVMNFFQESKGFATYGKDGNKFIEETLQTAIPLTIDYIVTDFILENDSTETTMLLGFDTKEATDTMEEFIRLTKISQHIKIERNTKTTILIENIRAQL